jgi:outer membrane protein assembly factor BamB
MKPHYVAVLLLLQPILFQATRCSAEQWPQFRGPTGQGLTEHQLPIEWGGPDAKNVLWKSPLVGEGHASPIVWNDRIFVCTARWPAEVDSIKQREEVIPEHHVLCFRLTDGELLWDTLVKPGPWLRTDFRSGAGGGYAAPTPATDGEHVFVVFGSSVIAALDFTGRIVWRKVIEPHTFNVCIGASPVLYEDTVLMHCAMKEKKDSMLVAYDKSIGSIRWQTPLPNTAFGHSTPTLIEVQGKPQLVTVASGINVSKFGVQSFNPANGELLWWCRGAGDAASAAFGAGVVYTDSGRGGPGVAIDPTGSGDVTETHIKWEVDQVPEGIASPVIVDDLVYRLHRPNVLKCWQVEDGKEVYTKRLSDLSSTWATPIVDAAGRMYIANAGISYVIQTGRDFKVLATNDLQDPNHASPAVIAGKILLVGTRNIYCIGE